MSRRLVIVSYNIRTSIINEVEETDELHEWEHRKGEVLKIIRRQNPDVFGVQEDSPEQLRDLRLAFGKDYHIIFHTGAVNKHNPEHNALFVKKKYKVLDTGYYWISETPEVESRIRGSMDCRHLNYALVKISNEDYLFANVHLDNSKDLAFKKKEAGVLVKLLKDKFLENLKKRFVLLGDFNFITHDTDAYKKISQLLVDVSREEGVREPTFRGWLTSDVCRQSDFFWVSPSLKDRIVSFDIVKDKYTRSDGIKMEPSDHFLIKASLKV